MTVSDGPDVTEVASKTEWAAYKTSAARQCKTMVVGFFAGDALDDEIGNLLHKLSEEYPKTWFYSVDTGKAEDVAGKCDIHTTPTVQVWQDSMKVKVLEDPSERELAELMEEYGQAY